jgi:Mn-dependent DtxR family transcriptional regulator
LFEPPTGVLDAIRRLGDRGLRQKSAAPRAHLTPPGDALKRRRFRRRAALKMSVSIRPRRSVATQRFSMQ